LNAKGNTPLYSTYLGGESSSLNRGYGIAVDKSGNVYVTGETNSTDFPIKKGFNSKPKYGDAFVTKLNPTASGSDSLVYSTLLGGETSSDFGKAIAVDSKGYAYVTGYTNSTDFPTKNAFSSKRTGPFSDAFVTKLNPAASGSTSLVYSTYLGGSHQDYGYGIAVDSKGNAYVTGRTQSGDFPIKNTFDKELAGSYDAFVMKLNPAASGDPSLVNSSYLGGKDSDYGYGIAVDSKGNTYVTGETRSADFPKPNAYQREYGDGFGDAFVTKISP
jgi:hypothetical protein